MAAQRGADRAWLRVRLYWRACARKLRAALLAVEHGMRSYSRCASYLWAVLGASLTLFLWIRTANIRVELPVFSPGQGMYDDPELWFQDVPAVDGGVPERGTDQSFRQLYGRRWAKEVLDADLYDRDGFSPWQFVVLGFHNSGASMVARLLMLMGAWTGKPEDLYMGDNPANVGRKDVYALNQRVMEINSAQLYPAWLGFDWDHESLTEYDRFRFKRDAKTVVRRLGEYSPWVMKDACLCWTIPLWMDVLQAPACVLTYRNPFEMAANFTEYFSGCPQLESASRLYMQQWHKAMLDSIRACVGVPTMLMPSVLGKPKNFHWFMHIASRQLSSMGQRNTFMPTQRDLKSSYFNRTFLGSIQAKSKKTTGSWNCSGVSGFHNSSGLTQAAGGQTLGDAVMRKMQDVKEEDVVQMYLDYWGQGKPRLWIPAQVENVGEPVVSANGNEEAMIRMWEEMLERVVVVEEDLNPSNLAQSMLDKYEEIREQFN
ncbi:unnamed protein product [Ostreobium quekettii]|uniref:Sulfotransferase n=1 Tax=Ostreobium quekettii TaxID=121088 RepID=A0A8S1J3X0_9CHLO|nr:unnamed protein product [Ostreobium quekettii]|eukprot:evm.model.scf_2427.3 EVM.evm.TU.scf_2427.3   scf_2427:16834-18291(+)